MKSVFKYSGELDKSAKNLINPHINRMRKEIEPDPEKPLFLVPVRNEGSRLNLSD